MSSNKLLILERSSSVLDKTVDSDGSVVLEGVFTEIGVKNKNNRVYEEKEVLPHINELQKKVKTSKLLGELDHPKDFDISLSNVSHVIEDLSYDPSTKQVMGRIRLLNTDKGKQAKALVEDGIPLHISSRAAGNVDENGNVKIKKFFTYDLVADPGFENAELSRVNESFGYESSDSLFIYEMKDTKDKKENTSKMEENNKFVTAEDFNKYTEYLANEMKSVKEAANSSEKETVEKLVNYTEHIAEKVNQLTDYTEYLSENLDKSIAHTDYVVENVNQIKSYAKYLAEELDNSIKYTEHVAEKADKGIQYTEHVAEKADQGIAYSEHLAEKLNQTIGYAEHIAEKADQGISYTEHVAEKADQGIAYSEHLAEKLNQSISYSEYLKEGLEKGISYTEYVAEKINESTFNPLTESQANPELDKINSLLESAKSKSIKPKGDMHFMNFLTESKKSEFSSLSEEKQNLIKEKMNSTSVMSTIQAENIWESAFKPQRTKLNFIEDMPEKFKAKWDNLTESKQSQIVAESKFYPLNTQYQINNFWQTRDLRPSSVELEKINESKSAGESANKLNESSISEERRSEIVNRVKFNLGRK